MEIDFNSVDPTFNHYEEKYKKLTEITLEHLGYTFNPIISISFVDNNYIHQINKTYRNIDRPTDVISFAFLDGEANRDRIFHSKDLTPLGDIYISLDKAKEQAISYNHSLERELSFLYVHGLLHLLGYDHMNKEDEEVMFALQEEILDKRMETL